MEEPVTEILDEAEDDLWMAAGVDTIAGTASGIAITLVGHPLDTLKVRLQAQNALKPLYSGPIDCMKKTLRWEGPAGLYRGVSSPLAGQMFFTAASFASYGLAKKIVMPDSDASAYGPQHYAAAGALSGLMVVGIQSPVDLFKSQLQMEIIRSRTGGDRMYTGMVHCVKKIWKERGIRGPFQGFSATSLRAAPGGAIYFGGYEFLKDVFTPEGEAPSHFALLAAGGIGGMSAWAFVYPLDAIKSVMQMDHIDPKQRKYGGFVATTKALWAEGGISRFYRGLSPCLIRAGMANSVTWLVYERTKEWLLKQPLFSKFA